MSKALFATAIAVMLIFVFTSPANAGFRTLIGRHIEKVRHEKNIATPNSGPDLSEYINKPDGAYKYKIVRQRHMGTFTLYTIHLTSLKWERKTWKHWLRIVVPDNLKHDDQAVLVIAGGSNRRRPKKVGGDVFRIVQSVVQSTGAIVAILPQVPNEPLFGDKKENELLAFSFNKYLDGGNSDWPVLLPMVKSAVKAMDTVQSVAMGKLNLDIKKFIVMGGSKRGWTTWLTAAVDKRVKAIAPLVIDMLNTKKQMRNQLKSYGSYSEAIHAFTKYGIIKKFSTPRGKKLLKAVDPFSYVNQLTMPKLIFSGTNDPYWTVDSDNLYFPFLKGESRLRYVANAGHGLSPTAIPTLLSFINIELNNGKLPELSWKHKTDGAFVVSWEKPGASATLWVAKSPTRDFRHAHWKATPLSGATSATAQVSPPKTGWLAYYVTVQFPAPNPCKFSTTMTVLPRKYPFKIEKVNGKMEVKSAQLP